jgi:hypothetical protein
MRLGLGLALLAISWGARAFGGTMDVQLWERVQLPRELRDRFISDSGCYKDFIYLRSCLRALHAAADLVPGTVSPSFTDDDIRTLIRDPRLHFSVVDAIEKLSRSGPLPSQLIWGHAIAARLQEYDQYADLIPSAEEESARGQRPLVEGMLLSDQQTGFISLSSFDGRELCAQVSAEIQKLVAGQAKRLLLDLRDNRGGNRRNALCIAGLFMGFKSVIGVRSVALAAPSVRGLFHANPSESVRWLSGTQPQLTNLPLAIWINHNSGSASEVLAGGLQSQRRALLLGETSRGKARVQMVEPLRDTGLSLSLTVEELVLPDGRSYQDKGLLPDVFVPSSAVPEFVTKVLLN